MANQPVEIIEDQALAVSLPNLSRSPGNSSLLIGALVNGILVDFDIEIFPAPSSEGDCIEFQRGGDVGKRRSLGEKQQFLKKLQFFDHNPSCFANSFSR